MNSLSHYEKQKEPVLLRHDYVKGHQGTGYLGSKLKEAELLFTYNVSPKMNTSGSFFKPNQTKRSSSVLKKGSGGKSPNRPTSNVILNTIQSFYYVIYSTCNKSEVTMSLTRRIPSGIVCCHRQYQRQRDLSWRRKEVTSFKLKIPVKL